MCNVFCKAVLAVCLGLSASLFAAASSIPAGTYNLSGVTVNGSALTGSLTLDASGMATSASLAFTDQTHGSLTFTNIASTGTSGNSPVADFAYISGANGQVTLYYLTTLSSGGGITICESGTGCSVNSNLQIYSPNFQALLQSGSLTASANSARSSAPAALTPEPTSLILLGTGLIAIVGFVALRRKRQDPVPVSPVS